MKRFHLIFGVAVVIVFLLTGQYMEYVGNPQMPDGTRMLYRSRHIYILLSGLLNLLLGAYCNTTQSGWRRKLQITGSVLMVLAPGLLLVGFFLEPHRGPEETLVAGFGIYAAALGTVMHVIGGQQNHRGDWQNVRSQNVNLPTNASAADEH